MKAKSVSKESAEVSCTHTISLHTRVVKRAVYALKRDVYIYTHIRVSRGLLHTHDVFLNIYVAKRATYALERGIYIYTHV